MHWAWSATPIPGATTQSPGAHATTVSTLENAICLIACLSSPNCTRCDFYSETKPRREPSQKSCCPLFLLLLIPPYSSRMRFRSNQPIVPAVVDAARMPTLADINDGPWVNANPVMKSDMVKPIPARHPTAQR